jgi:homoserine O-acetyltransferase
LTSPSYEDFDDPLLLDCGRVLASFRICYESYGTLAPDGGNAILLCHGMSADAHAMGGRESGTARPGWWDMAVGPGKMLDTDRYFVVCSNVIGGSGGSTGPSALDPLTGRPFGTCFPVVTIPDMVRAQMRLIDRLGISQLQAVIGGCFGGHQALQWGVAYGDRVRKIIAITVRAAASAYTLALWELVRATIRSDPAWLEGDYYTSTRPSTGIGLATALSLLQWMDADFMQVRYGREREFGAPPLFNLDPEFAVQKMMARVIEGGQVSLDPNSLLYLTKAADYFDLSAGCSSLAEALSDAGGEYLLVSYERDTRYPVAETERLAQALRRAGRSVSHVVLSNALSHGAYLYDLAGLDTEVRAFLS